MKAREIVFFDYKGDKASNLSVGMHYINNLGSEEDEFLCFGITDSINIELNKIKNIMAPKIGDILKHKTLEDTNEIGKNLDVDYILKGSLMKMGSQFRLSISMHNIVNS